MVGDTDIFTVAQIAHKRYINVDIMVSNGLH